PFEPGQAISCSTVTTPEYAIIEVRTISYQTTIKKGGTQGPALQHLSDRVLVSSQRIDLRGILLRARFSSTLDAIYARGMRTSKDPVRVLGVERHRPDTPAGQRHFLRVDAFPFHASVA